MKFNYITIFLIVFPAIVISKMETFCCVCKSSKSKTGSCATSGFNNKCPGTTKDCDAFGNNCGYCIAEDNFKNGQIIAGICYEKGYYSARGDICYNSPYCGIWGCDIS